MHYYDYCFPDNLGVQSAEQLHSQIFPFQSEFAEWNWPECWDFHRRDTQKYKVHLSESFSVFAFVSLEMKPLNNSFSGLIAMA